MEYLQGNEGRQKCSFNRDVAVSFSAFHLFFFFVKYWIYSEPSL